MKRESTIPGSPAEARSSARDFSTTRWSVVQLAAEEERTGESARALEALCRAYWYPLYAFVRRKGNDAHEAQDLIQGYFQRLIEKGFLRAADEGRGRFRTFLLTSLSHYMADEWRRGQARKRGGGSDFFPLATGGAEERYRLDVADHLTADKIYERRWADTVLGRALERLQEAYAAEGRADHFTTLRTYLTDARGTVSYARAAEELKLSTPAIKSAIRRLRLRYGDAIRAEIGETVGSHEEMEDEIRHLFAVLSS